MTLHKVTNGERDLCSECYRGANDRFFRIFIPYSCTACTRTKLLPDMRQVCNDCYDKIAKDHIAETHIQVNIF